MSELVSRTTGALVPVQDVVNLLSASYLDVLQQRLVVMREEFRCPPRVSSPEEFRAVLGAFYLHYEQHFHGVEKTLAASREEAFSFITKYHRGDLAKSERNAILGRDRGMIHVIDEITEALIKQQTDAYLDRILWEYLPTDPAARLSLAEELVSTYSRLLCPGDEPKPAYVVAADLERICKDLGAVIRAASKEIGR